MNICPKKTTGFYLGQFIVFGPRGALLTVEDFMKNFKYCFSFLIFLGCVNPTISFADMEKAIAATQAGEFETAYTEFLESAGEGNADAQLNLGIMYLLGDGSMAEERNFGPYVMFFFNDSTSGTQWRSFYPGWFRENIRGLARDGVGVPADYEEALRLFLLSADQGNRYAQFNLGIMYTHGFGTERDFQEAPGWYRLAAEQGFAKAQTEIGTAYRYGSFDLPVDKLEAIQWLRLAAEQGEGDAQTYLGYMYGTGEGVPEDDITAFMWYSLGALNGNFNATGTVKYIDETLNPNEIAEVERRTKEWLEEHQ